MKKNPETQERPKQEPRAYSIGETAELCGVSRATLYRLLAQGKIRSIKIGTRRLIRDDQINALLAGGA